MSSVQFYSEGPNFFSMLLKNSPQRDCFGMRWLCKVRNDNIFLTFKMKMAFTPCLGLIWNLAVAGSHTSKIVCISTDQGKEFNIMFVYGAHV